MALPTLRQCCNLQGAADGDHFSITVSFRDI
jgi:hypothetical protein